MNEKTVRKKDKYRPAFCDTTFYSSNQNQFKIIQKNIENLHILEQITVWVLTCTCLRRPHSWFSGQQALVSNISSAYSKKHFSMFQLFKQLNIDWPKKLNPEITLEQFTSTVRIIPLPYAAANALYHFYLGHYPIEILCYEPEPLELLKYQIQGKRILTFNPHIEEWPQLKYGDRDPLSFWLHDLIHAEHFFSDPQNRQGQIGFYRLIHEILNYKILDTILVNNEFNKAFSYLMSDMNAHPLHLIKTLRAYLKIHSEPNCEHLWDLIIQLPSINNHSEIQMALKRVNKELFTDDDAVKLTNFFNRSFDLDLSQNDFINTPQL
jgi:hypothetical protein